MQSIWPCAVRIGTPQLARLLVMADAFELDTQKPWSLINQCPAYQATPLRELTTPAGQQLLIKDESALFKLGAFKALGGIYAVASFLLQQWQAIHKKPDIADSNLLFDKAFQNWASQFTFVCASAGNHGMAVAMGAQLFNSKSRIYLAETVPDSFAIKLRALGAQVVREGQTYEDSMQAAQAYCENGSDGDILLADSSWPGYTRMPLLVMEGYTVLAEEMRRSFETSKDWPTHVFLHAGVGGLAAAVAFHIRRHWAVQPKIIVVEPDAAPCLFESNRRGALTSVKGPVSSMGRLDCKEASMLAFEALKQYADEFVCITESEAAEAVAMLAANSIATTPSGAAGVAAVLAAARLTLDIPARATSLAIVTEEKFQ